jgi:DNA-binding transcriptional ArsR family regulator
MDVFEALADPTRREIVAMLAGGERNAGDIAARFPMRVLRESGVVSYRKNATAWIYRLEPGALGEAEQWMRAQLEVLHARFDRLESHLDRMKERGD